MRYNLHTHTHRCRHAQGSDRDYVEAAIAAGIKTLGFSDHCPQFFPGGYYSTFRMFPEEAAEYAESVRSLAREYAADIRILLGFETEYYPELFPELRRLVRQLGCDYLILGQHFIKNEYDYPFFRASEPPRADIDRYLSQVLEGLRTGSFTYIAHPDILGFRGGDEVFYRERMKTFCETLREMDIPAEYNMLGRKYRKWYPNPVFWRTAAEAGCKAVIGYDAHSPEMLRDGEAFRRCLNELKGCGLSPVPFGDIRIRRP
ncbi:MAG: histidinol-phosphatase [Ruminococcus sp.]